ncbi:hypothetical protein H1D32_12690 [Anaerobacillus sp. CMMVII]|uniref:hypothetical protein n=1 Tax=Anaerobacillus sp. CMMVII TaxID=2755588 RepID=UPI0021B7B848|nr:hypothetical protein [Anaerobacillus sp. CMMVII]MCT8138522.1 hypothetical protein [Anaerobacillus sp. CMMVII]
MKKISAIIVGFVLLFSLSLVASAEENTSKEEITLMSIGARMSYPSSVDDGQSTYNIVSSIDADRGSKFYQLEPGTGMGTLSRTTTDYSYNFRPIVYKVTNGQDAQFYYPRARVADNTNGASPWTTGSIIVWKR